MSGTAAVKRIGIFGHVGNGNLGDEAIIAVVIDNIRQRYPSAEILGFTLRPEDTSVRHQIQAFPIRRFDHTPGRTAPSVPDHVERDPIPTSPSLPGRAKATLKTFPRVYGVLKRIQEWWHVIVASAREPGFLLQSYRRAEGLDLLIVAGSSQLIDYVEGGPWGHPYTILKWVMIAKARKTKIAFVSCGVGPLQTMLGRLFCRVALSLADYRSYRDEVSSKCAEQIGVSGSRWMTPDLVYGLRLDENGPGTASLVGRPIVGINPVPFSDPKAWVGTNSHAYQSYVGKLAGIAVWLIHRGYAVMFFPTQLRADPPVIGDILNVLTKGGASDIDSNVIQCDIRSFDDLTAAISRAEMIIATRFHGVVFSYLLHKPVIGIAYARKTNDLMAQMGQADYALDIMNFDLETLQERFVALESRKTDVRREIAQGISVHRQALSEQYARVFGLLETLPE